MDVNSMFGWSFPLYFVINSNIVAVFLSFWFCIFMGSLCQRAVVWVDDKEQHARELLVYKYFFEFIDVQLDDDDCLVSLIFLNIFPVFFCSLAFLLGGIPIAIGLFIYGCLYCVRWGVRMKKRVVKVEELVNKSDNN